MTGHHLDPAEHLLDALTAALAQLIAGMPGGARVDARPPPRRVLHHMRRRPQCPQVGHEIRRVVLVRRRRPAGRAVVLSGDIGPPLRCLWGIAW